MSLLHQSRVAASVRSNATSIVRVPGSLRARHAAAVPQLSLVSRQARLGRVAVSAYEVEDQEVNEERIGGRRGDDRPSYSFRVGDVVDGVVDGLRPFGAFIKLEGTTNGLLHISEVSSEFIDDINDHLTVGDPIKVYVKRIDRYEGRISLSTKSLERNPGDFITNRQAVFDGAAEMAAELRQQWEERRAQRDAQRDAEGGGGDWGGERRRYNDDGERPRGRGRGGGGRGRGGGGRGGGGRGRGGGDRYQERRDRYE